MSASLEACAVQEQHVVIRFLLSVKEERRETGLSFPLRCMKEVFSTLKSCEKVLRTVNTVLTCFNITSETSVKGKKDALFKGAIEDNVRPKTAQKTREIIKHWEMFSDSVVFPRHRVHRQRNGANGFFLVLPMELENSQSDPINPEMLVKIRLKR
ncbi:hypothetical protein Trydic_g1182 [Trypoxylus dichotomus]